MQISKIFLVLTIIPAAIFVFSSCGGKQSNTDEVRSWYLAKTDSLWLTLNATRREFVYPMDEIKDRKNEMDSFIKVLNVNTPKKVTDEMMNMVSQYSGILKLYKQVATEYKNCVVEGEDQFYQLKTLERSVRNGEYDGKLEEFKKTWNELAMEMRKSAVETQDVTSKLSKFEPLYLRIQPKIEALVIEVQR